MFAFPVAAAPWMQEKGAASPPSGYLAFCRGPEGACAADRAPGGAPRAIDARGLSALARFNRMVNAAIRPEEEPDGADIWRAGGASGDCEDYALTKRAALIDAGWSPAQVLVTVARTDAGAPHAALIARTSLGDYVLDNLTDDLLRWDQSSLSFISRQSGRLPALWVGL